MITLLDISLIYADCVRPNYARPVRLSDMKQSPVEIDSNRRWPTITNDVCSCVRIAPDIRYSIVLQSADGVNSDQADNDRLMYVSGSQLYEPNSGFSSQFGIECQFNRLGTGCRS